MNRLRYVRQLVASAPDVLWALVRLDAALLEVYRDAFRWLYGLLRNTIAMPDPLTDWEPWCHVMCDRPGRFRGWVKRAKSLSIIRLSCGAALFALLRCIRGFGSAKPQRLSDQMALSFVRHAFPAELPSARDLPGHAMLVSCMDTAPKLPCSLQGLLGTGAVLVARSTLASADFVDTLHTQSPVRRVGVTLLQLLRLTASVPTLPLPPCKCLGCTRLCVDAPVHLLFIPDCLMPCSNFMAQTKLLFGIP